ncbi:YcxB family protein [Flavobacterium taihuense]|uniref:YcxB family protein n=1 Tax=Flavobacterium taihuense TaxID=2857508 RepID=A0ABS6XV53_9FLAO|nr:YcxB family protein [Flavobacterium taihuense]MBW4359764.1 YcxB family protein [Flavobacterium taihuense]
MEKEITIKYKPNIDTLVKVSKYLLIRMPFLKIAPFLIVIFILQSNLGTFLESNNNTNLKNWNIIDIFPFVLIITIWAFVYFRTMSTMKKNILKNKKNLETQKISFKNNSFIQEGETFKIENFWKDSYQIKETNEWFLIYLQKNSALPIIKADLKDNQYNELRLLFNSIDIKKSLKN